MKDKSTIKKGIQLSGQSGDQPSQNRTSDNEDLKDNKSRETISFSEMNSHIKKLEKELSKKESEIEFLKEKFTNNQEVLLDVIQDKKLLKEQIHEFELKELDERLNNFRDLQRKHHKTQHRLFVTKKLLNDSREDIKFREKVIEEMENRRLLDYILGRFPESFKEYKTR